MVPAVPDREDNRIKMQLLRDGAILLVAAANPLGISARGPSAAHPAWLAVVSSRRKSTLIMHPPREPFAAWTFIAAVEG